jgi:multicomponent Na+:H+ antiporter subunit D
MMLFLPILIPFAGIVLMLFSYGRLRLQQALSLVLTGLMLLQGVVILQEVMTTGPVAMQAGGWAAPFGITFYADLFTAIMLVTTGLLGLISALYAIGMLDAERRGNGFFLLLNGLLAGVNGAFLTGDIFNLYVWFEVMLISSFVLITLGAGKGQLRGAVKYVVLNLIGSVMFVTAIGLMYGQTGTLNMADIARLLHGGGQSELVNASLMLFFVAFGIKSALFPFFFWLPASYPAPPVAITALFAGTLTKVGVYSIIRFYSLFVTTDLQTWQIITFIIAGATMVSGVLMAASSYHIRKILSFHIISQIGYMIMGVAFGTVLGLAGAIYFIVHNMLSKTAAFLAGGLIARIGGSDDLKSLGGVYRLKPLLAFLFFVPALSLAGIPPTPGFFGKFFLILGGFQSGNYAITLVAIAVGLITLFSMVKIWNEAVWKKPAQEIPATDRLHLPHPAMGATIALVVITLAFGILTGFVASTFLEAGEQLKDVPLYIQTVLKV